MKSNFLPRNMWLSLWTGVSVLGLVACSSTPPSVTTESASKLPAEALTVLFNQGREGQIEPCGCHSTPYGGLDREWNAVKEFRKKYPRTLHVESGDLFAPLKRQAPVEFYRGRTAVLVQMLSEMGVQVFGPGAADYSLGLAVLKKAETDAKFKFVSTNVVDKKGKPVFSPVQLVDVTGEPVAVLSILSEKAKLSEGLRVENPAKSIEKALKQVPSAKKVIILSNLADHVEDRKLAAQVPAISIVIGNADPLNVADGEVVGNTILVDGHRFGYFLGLLRLEEKPGSKGVYSEKVIQGAQQRLAGYEQALAILKDPKRVESVKTKMAELKRNEALSIPEGASAFEAQIVALDGERFGSPNAFTQLIQKEKDKLRAAAIDSVTPTESKKAEK